MKNYGETIFRPKVGNESLSSLNYRGGLMRSEWSEGKGIQSGKGDAQKQRHRRKRCRNEKLKKITFWMGSCSRNKRVRKTA